MAQNRGVSIQFVAKLTKKKRELAGLKNKNKKIIVTILLLLQILKEIIKIKSPGNG